MFAKSQGFVALSVLLFIGLSMASDNVDIIQLNLMGNKGNCFHQADFASFDWANDNTCAKQPCTVYNTADPYHAYCLKMACANTQRDAWCAAGGSSACKNQCGKCSEAEKACLPADKCFSEANFANFDWANDNTCAKQPCTVYKTGDPYHAYCLKMACANTKRDDWCAAGGSGACRDQCGKCSEADKACLPADNCFSQANFASFDWAKDNKCAKQPCTVYNTVDPYHAYCLKMACANTKRDDWCAAGGSNACRDQCGKCSEAEKACLPADNCFSQANFASFDWANDNTCAKQPCTVYNTADPYHAYCLKMACANTKRDDWCAAGGSNACRDQCGKCSDVEKECLLADAA